MEGILYEYSSGLFHRKTEWKRLLHDSYCIDGFFNNSLCYSISSDDNYILKEKCRQIMKDILFFCEEVWHIVLNWFLLAFSILVKIIKQLLCIHKRLYTMHVQYFTILSPTALIVVFLVTYQFVAICETS
jgi:hypothetical protein